MYFILDNLETKAKVPSPPPGNPTKASVNLNKGVFRSFSLEQIFKTAPNLVRW